MKERSWWATVTAVIVAAAGFGLAVVGCGGGDSGSSSANQGDCPSGQNPGCFGSTPDTCYCGTYCSGTSDCPSPNICTTNVCTSLADYCHALLAANHSAKYPPCAPYRQTTTSTTSASCVGAVVPNTCVDAGYLACDSQSCCPPSTPFFCIGSCYASAQQATDACGAACIQCQ